LFYRLGAAAVKDRLPRLVQILGTSVVVAATAVVVVIVVVLTRTMQRIVVLPDVAMILALLGISCISDGNRVSAARSKSLPSCCDRKLPIHTHNIGSLTEAHKRNNLVFVIHSFAVGRAQNNNRNEKKFG